jgi:HD-GYP domain-containing protein (c-di-GMP phosphodiesterase class II)
MLPLYTAAGLLAAAFAVLADAQEWGIASTAIFGALALTIFLSFVAAPWLVAYYGSAKEDEPRPKSTARVHEVSVGTATRLTVTKASTVEDAIALAMRNDERDNKPGEAVLVGDLAGQVALTMELPKEEQERVLLAGALHDVGMLFIDPSIPATPGALMLEQRREIQRHPEMGAALLDALFAAPRDVVSAVRHHHERVDGQGYPYGLVGDEIPLPARIVAVVEAFVAMTHNRPYRDAMPPRVAQLRLLQAAGVQFDVSVVAAFEALTIPEQMPGEPQNGSLEDDWDTYSRLAS